MSLPTKRSATSTTSNNNNSSSSSNPNPNPTSPPPFSAMKKAKSQAAALDPKNGLHHQDFNNSNNNNSDVVFDPSSMSVDDDFKPHDSSAPSPSPAPPRAVAANLSRKKAQPPQPPKKLVIKLLKDRRFVLIGVGMWPLLINAQDLCPNTRHQGNGVYLINTKALSYRYKLNNIVAVRS
uniref:Uncharacterized protein n=1 Tax=Quercus lobata TaxID=97700 RepID=A0A7N2RDW8_QUELO